MNFKHVCSEFSILEKTSRLTFANVFKVMNDEYGTHSKEDGEKYLLLEEKITSLMKIMTMIIFVPENDKFLP